MSCDRCVDIHNAQKSGLTQIECKCSCHITTPYNHLIWINSTSATTGTVNIV